LLFENTARAMGDASLHIKERHVANCAKADPAYGAGVAKALGSFQAAHDRRGVGPPAATPTRAAAIPTNVVLPGET